MSTTVSYKGNTLATVSNNTKTLETEGKYLEADIILTDVSQAAPVLETVAKSYTPTESQQTESITPGVGYDGIAEVDVTVGAISSSYVGSGITRRDSTDLSASGATVSVPSGYYASSASKAVASGTAGTPTATKSAVSNHAVTVTPSVTNSTGYITGSTINGTAVSVTASELVSGTYTVSGSGTADVTNYASISVPSGTAGTPTAAKGSVSNHTVSVTPSVTNSTGWITGSTKTGTAVSVSASELVSGTYSVSGSGTADVTNYASVSVPSGTAGTPTATKGTVSNHSVTVTPSVTNTTGYITGSTKTGTAVTVSASELVSGSETKTANGTYDVTNLAELVVNVSGGGSSGTQTDLIVDEPGGSGYITFRGLKGEPTSFVLIALSEIQTSSTPRAATVVYDGNSFFGQLITNTNNAQVSYTSGTFSANYNNGTLTVYASGADFIEIYYGLLYSYGGSAGSIGTSDVQVGSGATSITFTGLEDEPIYWSCVFKSNFSTSNGYQRTIAVASDNGAITGLEMDTAAHSTEHWTSSYSNGSLTITSNGTNQGGYFHQPGYYQLTYAIGEASPYQTKSVTYTPATTQQTDTITADTGYDALRQVNVTVNAMPAMTLPSSASATSSGTSKATITPTSSAQYLNIPTGYNATAQYYTIAASSGGGGSLTVATKTLTNTATAKTLSFTSLSGQPKYWFLRVTSNVSSSGSTTYYYITDCFYDGTSVKGNTFRIGSTRRVQNITSGITQSYSNGTLTITAGSSSGSTPGQFYGASGIGYELVYIY